MRFLNKNIIIAFVVLLSTTLLLSSKEKSKPIGKDYMIIVAVGEFATSKVYTPMNLTKDVEKIRESFKNYKLRPNHKIIELINKDATKDNILKSINSVYAKLTKNDRFYFYFSGHGTSPIDPSIFKYINAIKGDRNFLNDTSALIPYDFDENNLEQSLIIGSRDLEPIIDKIDEIIDYAAVMIDACFSSNMVRKEYIPARTIGRKVPYKNTRVISSAGRTPKIGNRVSTMTRNISQCLKNRRRIECAKSRY